jgi:cell wall-associated NlpC family hydrolase
MIIGFLTVSCGPVKRLVSVPSSSSSSLPRSADHMQSTAEGGSKRVYKDVRHSTGKNARELADHNPYLNVQGNIENSNELQFKYAVLADVPVEALSNLDLLNFMDQWYGTPYRYGGSTKDGIDCSAFTLSLMSSVFGMAIPRTVREQYKFSRRIDRSELQLGDLVFFNTRGYISHVGVYLINNKFVHASTSSGVMISDLDDSYFVKRYVGAGRIF